MTQQSVQSVSGYEQLLLARTPSLLACFDASFQLLYANPAFARWLGRDPALLAGRSLREVLGPELFALNEPYMQAALKGTPQTFERVIPGPTSSPRPAIVNYTPHVRDGVVQCVLVEIADVTLLKAGERALRRSEEYLRELMQLTTEAILVAGEDGRFTDANAACCELLGRSRDELLGQRFEDLVPGSEVDRVAQVRDEMRTGQRQAQEWTLLRRDGTPVAVEARVKFLSDGSRVGLLRDISTYRRRLEAEQRTAAEMARLARSRTDDLRQTTHDLRASEARLLGIFESTVDGIIVADGRQRIVQVNPAAAGMFRSSTAAMTGMPLECFIPERYRARHRSDVEAFGAGHVTARHMGAAREVLGLRADGTEFPIEATVSHSRVDGQPLYTVIHRDVTERRRIERELQEGATKLRTALDAMSDAVAISDTQGRLVEINEGFVVFHRFSDMASCPRDWADYAALMDVQWTDGTSAPPREWAVPRALRGQTRTNVEYRLRRMDTGEAWIGSYSFAPLRAPDGSITGSVMVARDITAIKAVQFDLEASQAALQRMIAEQDRVQDEERARIARELHDDLQQLLAAIRIDLVALADRLQAQAVDQQLLLTELDGLAGQAIESVRRIVDDLRPKILEDGSLVAALQMLAERFTRLTGIACRVDADEELSKYLESRPQLTGCLFRVAQEALNNAGKHSKATQVELRLALVHTAQVSLSVVDNGRGIGAQDRRKTESFGILGMGERVRAQGGRLRVEPRAAGGTRVEALIPLGGTGSTAQRPGPPEDQSAAATDPAAHGMPPVPPVPPSPAPDPLAASTLPRLLSRAARQAVQIVIDAIADSAAVLDRKGVVQCVNRAWNAFAACNGAPGAHTIGPGVDYLEACRKGARDDPSVLPIVEGLAAVIEGRAPRFSSEYVCHSPTQQRWFRVEALPMVGGDVLITHVLLRSQERRLDGPGR